jgi:hypothetical protein
MNAKSLSILAAASVVVLGAALMMNKSRATKPTESTRAPESSAPLLLKDLAGKATSVAKLSLKQGTTEVVLTKSGDEWLLASKSNFPAKIKNISDVVDWAAQARITQEKTAKPDLHAKIGVEDPASPDAKSTLVTFSDASGAAIASVIVGNADSAASGRFARLADSPQSYLVSGTVDVPINPLSWIDSKVIQLASSRLAGATFTLPNPAGGDPLVTSIRRTDPNDNTFELENIPAGRKVKDEFAAARAAQCLAFANFEDVRPLSEVNFDVPQASFAEFKTLDNLVVRATVVLQDDRRWIRFTAAHQPPAPPAPAAQPADPTPSANAAASIDDPAPAPTTPTTPPPTDDPKAAEVKKEAEDLNALFTKWAFALPEFTTSRLQTKIEDLLTPPESPTAEGPNAPSGPTLPQ